jgi:peptidoglycan hydrolase-like protein with peptidoglycan-binding domain
MKREYRNNPWKTRFRMASKIVKNSHISRSADTSPAGRLNRDTPATFFGQDMSGNINQQAQHILNQLGANPPLTEDGVIGPLSQAQIRIFQQTNGVPVTGNLDQATLSALGLITKPKAGLPTLPRIPIPFGKKGQTITIANVKGINKLSQSDLLALVNVANNIGIHPDWLASVMSFESGFNPAAKNAAGSGATGLIQFMPSTAQNMGTSTAALAQMTFQEQLPYVQKYFEPHAGKLQSLEDTYLAVFYPAFIGKPDSEILGHSGSAIYDQNAGFDRTDKGYVTKQDITSTIRGVLASAAGTIGVTTAVAATIGLGTLLGLFGAAWGAFTFAKTGKVWPLAMPWG